MNRVILNGRTTKEHDLRYAPKSGVAYLFNSLAVENYSKKKQKVITDFFKIVVSGKNAENLATYTEKGGRIFIEGYLRNNSYEVNGEKRYSTEIVVEKLKIIDFIKKDSKENSISNDMELVEEDIPDVFAEELDFLSRKELKI